ncbi:hypothetical protein J3458_001778 [Metarhizium acridum]|uniref:uncharacterized protein n=1 Tax=Metarhizium acridum TaxID=92637 RepID=UPI001C6B138D|nr:hypothetical protein J3458_001778 [Metarhizium acridum]
MRRVGQCRSCLASLGPPDAHWPAAPAPSACTETPVGFPLLALFQGWNGPVSGMSLEAVASRTRLAVLYEAGDSQNVGVLLLAKRLEVRADPAVLCLICILANVCFRSK